MLLLVEKERRERANKRDARALNREEAMKVYGVVEEKSQAYSNRAFDRVEEMYSSFYAGLDPRRRQEMADGGMAKEDRAAMANLSEKAIHRQYPPAGYYSTPYIDDSVKE